MMERDFRVALYSHDGMGIGHFRRNLLIARALVEAGPDVSVLLIAGACELNAFAIPVGVDYLTVPSLRKRGAGQYEPRRLCIATDELLQLRSRVMCSALQSYNPDLLVVDKVPRGIGRELEPALRALRNAGRTQCVLGLRDILDEPGAVRREWDCQNNEAAVDQFYDAVWIYGDPLVCDPVAEYGFGPGLAAKVRYIGYLERRDRVDKMSRESSAEYPALSGQIALCLVGGGEDGTELAEAFALAELPAHLTGIILTGPLMPPEIRRRLHAQADRRCGRLRIIEVTAAPERLLNAAERVVTMGGYNTVSEVLCAGKRALVVPRIRPRLEQLIRAQRLQRLGLIDMLDPRQLSPSALGKWLAQPAASPDPDARSVLNFDGLAQIAELAQELRSRPPAAVADIDQMKLEPIVVSGALEES